MRSKKFKNQNEVATKSPRQILQYTYRNDSNVNSIELCNFNGRNSLDAQLK